MCYNFSIALDSRFEKESTMGKNLNAEKAYAKERTGYIPQDAIPKMGNGEKILQVAARSQAKEPHNHRPYALLLETGLRTGD